MPREKSVDELNDRIDEIRIRKRSLQDQLDSISDIVSGDCPREIHRGETALTQQKAVQSAARVSVESHNRSMWVDPPSRGACRFARKGQTPVFPLKIETTVYIFHLLPARMINGLETTVLLMMTT
jgi:hypothetical protein